jgi:hypothetical protein
MGLKSSPQLLNYLITIFMYATHTFFILPKKNYEEFKNNF